MIRLRLLNVFLVLFIFNSCVENVIDDKFELFNEANLNEKGKAFIRTLQLEATWQKDWNLIQQMGTPVPNEVMSVYSFDYGMFLVLPVVNNKEITHVVFYPLSQEKNAIGKIKEPVIIRKGQKKCPEFVKSFFATKFDLAWEDKKLLVRKELKKLEYNSFISCDYFNRVQKMAITRSDNSYFTFPADIWVEFIYTSGSGFDYRDKQNRIIQQLNVGLYHASMRVQGVRYRCPGQLYDVDVDIPRGDFNSAEYSAIIFLDFAMGYVQGLSFVNKVWAIYQWSPSLDNGGGSLGGWAQQPQEPQRCPECQKTLNFCQCPELLVDILIDKSINGIVTKELLEPYNIEVSVRGRRKNDVDVMMIQMAKHPNVWVPIAYGQVSNYKFQTTRKSFNPGAWLLRIGYTYNDDSNINYSETRQIYELWPSIDKFKDDPHVTNFLRNLWDKGCAFARENAATHSVREYGAFIFLNPDGSYSCTEVEPGPTVQLNKQGVCGSLVLNEADCADLTDWDNPKRQIPLVVGTMHTHYPLTWAAKGIVAPVGPSSKDKSGDQVWPGLVYDYTYDVKAGDPEKDASNPLKIWLYGPTRRKN